LKGGAQSATRNKAAAGRLAAKKSVGRKAIARSSTAKNMPVKKKSLKKTTPKKTIPKKAPVKKASAKKAVAGQVSARKTTARKTTARLDTQRKAAKSRVTPETAASRKATRKSVPQPQVARKKVAGKQLGSRRRPAGHSGRSRQAGSRNGSSTRMTTKNWVRLSDEELLDCRMCDLNLNLERSPLRLKIRRLYKELADRGLDFQPHFWLSDEWFAPDGIPGIAIPFYLAHPRLCQLERKMMLEVEGGAEDWCMKILRHETGHALDTAYGLHRKKRYREVFGSYSDPYPEYYRPHPKSRRFVVHLEPWYAQSHPAEDFAETFAVWLKPGSRWRHQYKDWPALKKLEYIDELMQSIAGTKPKVVSRKKIEPLKHIKRTLRQHYELRRARYEMDMPTPFDRDLLRLFFCENDAAGLREIRRQEGRSEDFVQQQASALLRKHKSEIERQVTSWTGENRYTVSLVMREVIDRCRELRLKALGSEARIVRDITIFITVQTMSYLHSGLHRVAL